MCFCATANGMMPWPVSGLPRRITSWCRTLKKFTSPTRRSNPGSIQKYFLRPGQRNAAGNLPSRCISAPIKFSNPMSLLQRIRSNLRQDPLLQRVVRNSSYLFSSSAVSAVLASYRESLLYVCLAIPPMVCWRSSWILLPIRTVCFPFG